MSAKTVPSEVTAHLARFVARTRWSDLPGEVVDKVLLHTLDILAVARAGTERPWNALVREHALAETPAGRCSVFGSSRRLRPGGAVLANATAAHGIELDDYHVPAAVHAGCVAIPTALAMAQQHRASSRHYLAAAAVGLETVVRLGLAFSPEITLDRGFHVTSVFGSLGAAAAAASILGLDPIRTRHALAIAIASAGGTTEYTRSGGEVKRAHAGFAAAAGVRAVDLARRGLTGPAHALEGPRGFAEAFGGARRHLDAIEQDLGSTWHLDGLCVKKWATCTGNHAPAAAAAQLRDRGVTADSVERIVVRVDPVTAQHCGHVGPRPTDMTSAQFSTHVAVALALLTGSNDLDRYESLQAGGWNDPEVTRLARCVRVEVGAAEQEAFGTAPTATVLLHDRAGATQSATAVAPGSPKGPLTWAEVRDKAHTLADRSWGPTIVDHLAEVLQAWRVDDRPIAELPL